ncbi:MAG: DUF3034 family protein [Casimicrobiaceae bacterium]|nr:DUF3034 family protein [Casimicrobiaceae bacterium]MDW8313245.1 DUF3034 family protein [Burkholderiales bacterium]
MASAIETMRCLFAFAVAVLLTSSASAQGFSGKLTATGGVSTVEGAGGGGLTPWALITGYGTDRQVGGNAHYTVVRTNDYALATGGIAVGIFDRLELSLAKQRFDTRDVLIPVSPALKGHKLEQDSFGVKLRLIGDAIYDQDRALPQIAIGLQHKRNRDDTVIPFLNGALGGGIRTRGTDFYLSATKLYLEAGILANGTLRFTKANQFGLLGFGGPDGDSYRPEFEFSLAYLVRPDLAVGVEGRTKRGRLANPALNLREQAAFDAFVAWFPSKHASLTLAYVDLGQIVGALTNDRRQRGWYASLQVGF